jgi:hypothetical protein
MPSEELTPIPQIIGKVYQDIKLGYTGGATELYIPVPPLPKAGVNIHAYDVNSLYPSVMLTNDYPIGNPMFFEGNIFLQTPPPKQFSKINLLVSSIVRLMDQMD